MFLFMTLDWWRLQALSRSHDKEKFGRFDVYCSSSKIFEILKPIQIINNLTRITQGQKCFFCFWKRLLAFLRHSFLQGSQVEHWVPPQISLWLFRADPQAWNPALSNRSRVAPKLKRTLSLSAFSAGSDSIFNALGAISTKLRSNSSVISSAHSLCED